VEWYWQGEIEDLGEKPVPVPLYPPQIARGMDRVSTNRAYMDSAADTGGKKFS
jgi:hypothetical protein